MRHEEARKQCRQALEELRYVSGLVFMAERTLSTLSPTWREIRDIRASTCMNAVRVIENLTLINEELDRAIQRWGNGPA